uniref:Uncharacterized protein n=1 Tax=Arundo donax TaxID=35708 RepID=A0A0A9E8S2_ARUDO
MSEALLTTLWLIIEQTSLQNKWTSIRNRIELSQHPRSLRSTRFV